MVGSRDRHALVYLVGDRHEFKLCQANGPWASYLTLLWGLNGDRVCKVLSIMSGLENVLSTDQIFVSLHNSYMEI